MKITRGINKINLEVNDREFEVIFYCLYFCRGGVSDETEYQAIKMYGVYENFTEEQNEGHTNTQ